MERPSSSSFRASAFLAMAAPMIVSRAGLATMDIADGLMVARYQSHEFAWLSLAEGTIGSLLDICVALLIGGLILVPRHLARNDKYGAHLIWRRTLPVALALGGILFLISLAGTRLLTLAGESSQLAGGAGAVIVILAAGYPAALLAVAAAVYLEGSGRPGIVAAAVAVANLLNIGLNWVLIAGHLGMHALGARGSACSTTAVRLLLAVFLVASAWWIRPSRSNHHSEAQRAEHRAAARMQWRLGVSGAATTAAMVALAAPLVLFAGWMGVVPLAIFSAMWNIAAPAGLVSLGLADAAGIQVSKTAGAHSERRATSVAWSAMRVAILVVVVLVALWSGFSRPLADLYTHDPALRSAMPSLVPLLCGILLIDCAGFVAASSLRALREVAWPTSIEIVSMLLLVPLALVLTFHARYGVRGLFLAVLATGLLRTTLLLLRLRFRTPSTLTLESLSLYAESSTSRP